LLICLPAAASPDDDAPFHEPNAVILNITESDLNRIVRGLFHAADGVDGSRLEGNRTREKRGIYDFRYSAGLSEPVLELHEDGQARVDLRILDAHLSVGRLEKKILKRRMECLDTRASLAPETPVDVSLGLRFAIEDADLRIVPEQVSLDGMESFRLKRPARCRNNPLPEFLMWWIGKGKLRRKIERFDSVLLEKARDSAAELNEDGGLLAHEWAIERDDLPGADESIRLYPQTLDTSHGSLLIGLAGSNGEPTPVPGEVPDWVTGRADGSFVGLSESFGNFALSRALREMDGRTEKPSDSLRRLFKSDAIFALFPGLRAMELEDRLRLGFSFHTPPRIEFAAEAQRAVIRIRLSDLEMTLWDEERWLGAVAVDGATISVAPYHSRLGGISFDLVENDWRLSASGIEVDKELLAATLQEMLFGEVFETRYDPVADGELEVGTEAFDTRFFGLVGSHLIIGLAGAP
jgi:hypothetical protein